MRLITAVLLFSALTSVAEAKLVGGMFDAGTSDQERHAAPALNLRFALQCTRPDGTKYSCFCTDSDGRRQFPERCADTNPPPGLCPDGRRGCAIR
jgi:hypothetical protein